MSSVEYRCPEPTCQSRAYDSPGGTLITCGRHVLRMVQMDPTPQGMLGDPSQYAEPSVLVQMPTSTDAVTNDGQVVGHIEGVASDSHPLPPEDAESLVNAPEGE